jgi:hypothetical protein
MTEDDTVEIEAVEKEVQEMSASGKPKSKFILVHLTDPEGKMVVNVHLSGAVEYGEGYRPTTAANVFWMAVKEVNPYPELKAVFDAVQDVKDRAPDLSTGMNLRKHHDFLDTLVQAVEKAKEVGF